MSLCLEQQHFFITSAHHRSSHKCSASFEAHGRCRSLKRSLFLGPALLAFRGPFYELKTCSRVFSAPENKAAGMVMDSLTDWSSGQCVKVVGLGTRASTVLQFCHESKLLHSAELWVSSGDSTNLQSFGLLNKHCLKLANGRGSCEGQNIFILVLGMGANMFGKEVSDILHFNKAQSSLSLMIIIEPFNFEGPKRKKEIEEFAESFLDCVDICLVFELDVLLKRERVTLAEAWQVADSTVLYAIRAVSDLILGDQPKVFDAPPGGLQDISNSEILSVLKYAGKTWAGYAWSYSIKSAVQRALLEAPFLQGLIPGVKGTVICFIASAEEKGKQDIQAALHALRCSIGPRAHLICTIVKEPNLKRGLILATILLTRIDDTGSHDVHKQVISIADLSSPGGILAGGILGHSNSLNGRELRRGSPERSLENADTADIKLIGPKQQDGGKPSSFNSTDGISSALNTLDSEDFNVVTNGSADVCNLNTLEESSQVGKTTKKVAGEFSPNFKLAADKCSALPSSSDAAFKGPGTADFGTPPEGGIVNDLERAGEGNDFDACLDAVLPADLKDQIDFVDTQEFTFAEDDLLFEKVDDERWKLPSLSSVIRHNKETLRGGKKGLFGWESGPYSAAAEAWARTRQQLGNLGGLERTKSHRLPVGVKRTSDVESEPFTSEESSFWDASSLSTFRNIAAPLGRVLTSSLEAVTDIYNAASARIFNKDEGDDARQASSFLSERASSMLESERSSIILPPMVQMQYKNGTYNGRCQEGLPEGKGRLSYADGSFYYGLWKQGKRAGMGSFYYANGDVFQGYWRDDQKHGKGWFYFHTGDRLYADFWKGKANGEGRYYSAKGDVFFGYFKENWRDGEALSIEGGVKWSEIWNQGVLISRSRFEDAD